MGQWHSYDSIIFIFIFILILILNPGHEEKNRSRSETIYQSISSTSSSSGAPEGSMILLQSHSRFLLQSLLNRVQKYAPPPILFLSSLSLYHFTTSSCFFHISHSHFTPFINVAAPQNACVLSRPHTRHDATFSYTWEKKKKKHSLIWCTSAIVLFYNLIQLM